MGKLTYLDRLAPLAASVALGLWVGKGWPRLAVAAAGAWCLAWTFLPPRQGFGVWPSYSWPAAALGVAVLWAMAQLTASQRNPAVAIAALFGVTLWAADSLIMAPWCGAVIGWHFTAPTACGSAVGDLRAMVPTLLVLAGYLAWLRRAGRS